MTLLCQHHQHYQPVSFMNQDQILWSPEVISAIQKYWRYFLIQRYLRTIFRILLSSLKVEGAFIKTTHTRARAQSVHSCSHLGRLQTLL